MRRTAIPEYFLLLLCFTFITSCSEQKESNETNKHANYFDPIINEEPYNLQLKLDKLEDGVLVMNIVLELGEDCFTISPHSEGDYTGKFHFAFEDNQMLKMSDSLIESPPSVEGIDPWEGGPVRYVKENTTYTQKLIITEEEDFEVSGIIQFTIEPRCTFEEIPFLISRKSGELRIEKISNKKC